MKYRRNQNVGLFDKENTLRELLENGNPLTEEQKERNRQKSKVRSRVEHVFGFMEQTMGGLIFRGVGMMRAKANIALTNLVYNMCRLVQIKKYQPYLIATQ